MKFIEFDGAAVTAQDDGTLEYRNRGKISIEAGQIVGYYDHTVLTQAQKIRVMEEYEKIREKIKGAE